jgi:hypothetical protein
MPEEYAMQSGVNHGSNGLSRMPPSLRSQLQRSKPCAGAFFILRQIVRSAHAARSFYYVIATDWQAATAAYYGQAFPCGRADTSAIGPIFGFMAGNSPCRRGDRFSYRVAAGVSDRYTIHAIQSYDTAFVIAYSDADLDLQLSCLGDSTINDLFSFGEFQCHVRFPERETDITKTIVMRF